MWDLDAILTGGIAAAVVSSVFQLFNILVTKKVRTPADLASQRRADIVERNELLEAQRVDTASVRNEVKELKEEVGSLKRENKQQESEIDGLREEALARDHYIYRCLGAFHRLGMDEHIPQPVPFDRKPKETENG